MLIKTRPGFWKDLWTLLGPYWRSRDPAQVNIPVGLAGLSIRFPATERQVAFALLFTVIALTLGLVYMNVQFNSWYNDFYNTLQDKHKDAFYYQMLRFLLLASVWIVISVYSDYLNQLLQIRWRRWLTERYLEEWLTERAYYRLQLANNKTDNPDQRIAEDMRLLVDESLNLSIGLLNAVVTLVAFVGILWSLSGPLAIPLAGSVVNVPGYMVFAAIFYTVLGTWLTHLIGKPLAGMNFRQQRYEADFRFDLARFRENTEGVALYRGEADELSGFKSRFGLVAGNWWTIIKRQKLLTWFTSGHGQLAIVFPYLVAAPRFFSGAIQLGGLMQIANAFSQVNGALSWFINVYTGTGPNTGFVGWKATVDRLTGFHNAVMNAQAQQRDAPGVTVEAGSGTALVLDRVDLALPTGQVLVADAQARIPQGTRVLVRGPSGSGKTTLFRVIAGIWPFGSGRVQLPKEFGALFLPQRPYFPLGTLHAAVCYPAAAEAFSAGDVQEAITAVGLPQLCGRLDEEANWSMQLSGGEQQRVAFARALLQKPKWLFMDEATSALDEAAQAQLLRLLAERLPETTVVSIAHRPAMAQYHDRVLEIQAGHDGRWQLAWASAPALT